MTQDFILDKKVEDQVRGLRLMPSGQAVLTAALLKAHAPAKVCTGLVVYTWAALTCCLTLAFFEPIAGLIEAAAWVFVLGGVACWAWLVLMINKLFTLEREADGDKASWYLHWHQLWVWQAKRLTWPLRVAGLLVPAILLLFHNYYGSALLYTGTVAAVWAVGTIVASEVADFLKKEYSDSAQTY